MYKISGEGTGRRESNSNGDATELRAPSYHTVENRSMLLTVNSASGASIFFVCPASAHLLKNDGKCPKIAATRPITYIKGQN